MKTTEDPVRAEPGCRSADNNDNLFLGPNFGGFGDDRPPGQYQWNHSFNLATSGPLDDFCSRPLSTSTGYTNHAGSTCGGLQSQFSSGAVHGQSGAFKFGVNWWVEGRCPEQPGYLEAHLPMI